MAVVHSLSPKPAAPTLSALLAFSCSKLLWQEMYEEYRYSVQHCQALGRAPRLRVFLFPASEDGGTLLTPEQDLDGCNFFESKM